MDKSIGQLMDEKPMVGFQWGVVGLCFLINMLDGFDVLVMAFTAASVSSEWALSGIRLGYLLSAGLVGMAVGSLFIAPWADRLGRRPLILVCVTVAGVGMVSSSQASSPEMLAALRLLTGLGIGGVLASSYVVAGEYASKKWRGLAISLQSTAYALGATVGGLIAAQIIPSMGWRAVFFYGGIATLMTLPLLVAWLPESLVFLASRQPKGALRKINRLLVRVRLASIVELPQIRQSVHQPLRVAFAQLFSPALLRSTLLIWLAFFLVMFGFYFVMSWTPRLLVAAGLSNQQGITGGGAVECGRHCRYGPGWLACRAVQIVACADRLSDHQQRAAGTVRTVHLQPESRICLGVGYRCVREWLRGRALRIDANALRRFAAGHRPGMGDRHRAYRRDSVAVGSGAIDRCSMGACSFVCAVRRGLCARSLGDRRVETPPGWRSANNRAWPDRPIKK